MSFALSRHTKFADLPARTLADRCLLWTGPFDAEGYPRIHVEGKKRYAHRFIFEYAIRPLKEGERVYRSCGQRSCVNLSHLTTDPTPPKGDRGRPASTKLTKRKVQNILDAWEQPEGERPTQRELAKKYNVSRSCISLVVRGVTWKDA